MVKEFVQEVARSNFLGLDCEWVTKSTTNIPTKGKLKRTKFAWKRNKVSLLQLAPSDRLSVLPRLNLMKVSAIVKMHHSAESYYEIMLFTFIYGNERIHSIQNKIYAW